MDTALLILLPYVVPLALVSLIVFLVRDGTRIQREIKALEAHTEATWRWIEAHGGRRFHQQEPKE